VARSDDLQWDDLRYFLHAIQSKTLAGAARSMGVEHTTIGRRLSALERALGAALVVRGPDGLTLTPTGEAIVPLVREVERAVAAVEERVRSQKVRVRLAIPSALTGFFTAGLSELRRNHPQISLEIASGSRPVDLKNGEADLAIRAGPIGDEELVARKLCTVGWSLYGSEPYLKRRAAPTDVNDLSGHELVGYDSSLAATPAAKWVDERAASAVIVLRSREITDMLAAALSGVGLALLPCAVADAESKLTRLTNDVLVTREVALVFRREALLSEHVRTVIEFVTEIMRANAASMSGAR